MWVEAIVRKTAPHAASCNHSRCRLRSSSSAGCSRPKSSESRRPGGGRPASVVTVLASGQASVSESLSKSKGRPIPTGCPSLTGFWVGALVVCGQICLATWRRAYPVQTRRGFDAAVGASLHAQSCQDPTGPQVRTCSRRRGLDNQTGCASARMFATM